MILYREIKFDFFEWVIVIEEYQWLKKLCDVTVLPMVVQYDNQYEDKLQSCFSEIPDVLNNGKAPKSICDIATDYTKKILNAINAYYCGNIIEAHSIIQALFEECCSENDYAVSDVNNSPSFTSAREENNAEVQFFRARLNENVR